MRRRLCVCGLIVCALFCACTAGLFSRGTTALGESAANIRGVIVADGNVSMRAGPGISYERLLLLAPGSTFRVLSRSGDWYRIEYDGVTGYVVRDYVTVLDAASATQTQPAVSTVSATVAVNIRQSPDKDSAKLGQIAPGGTCEVLGLQDGWYLVRYESISGYVREDLLSVSQSVAGIVNEDQIVNVRGGGTAEGTKQEEPDGDAAGAGDAEDANAPDAAAQYRTVTERHGRINVEARVNVRGGPGTEFDIVCKVTQDDLFIVLDESGSWYLIEVGEVTGYISAQYVDVEDAQVQVAVIDEAPLEASITGFASPTLLKKGEAYVISGVVQTNVPMTRVTVGVYNYDTLLEERSAGKTFTRAENVTSFDISALDGALRMSALVGGEKKLRVTVTSANESKTFEGSQFSVLGAGTQATHVTGQCVLKATSGDASKMTDENYGTYWTPEKDGETVTVTIPEALDAELLTIAWKKPERGYSVNCLGADGEALAQLARDDTMVNAAFQLPQGTRKVEIHCANQYSAIAELRVYRRGQVAESVQQWMPLEGKADILFVSTHQDDELLFFGGAIPDSVARGKNTAVLYMANCNRNRYEEALRGMWVAGLRNHPIFLGLKDAYCETVAEAGEIWDRERALELLVEQIRKYRPEVVVVQDVNGEYGHGQHKFTSALTQEAVKRAGDANAYPQSAGTYGAWSPKKLYIHLYAENSRNMDWSRPLEYFDGRTALHMAKAAYDKHQSQQNAYSMDKAGVKYDNTKFGLAYTTVGYDVEMDDFFENIDE